MELRVLSDEQIIQLIRQYGADVRGVAYTDQWFTHNMPELIQVAKGQRDVDREYIEQARQEGIVSALTAYESTCEALIQQAKQRATRTLLVRELKKEKEGG